MDSLHSKRENWNVWDDTDPRVRDTSSGRIKGKPLSYQERTNVIRLLDKGFTHKKIQAVLNVHPQTIASLKKQIKEQNIPVSALGTLGVPRPGVQGGYRWSRMSEEQKATCSRIAVEHPTYTVSQIQKALVEVYPDLTVSEPTIWRALRGSGLHFMRAKMKDPRAEATSAHKAELNSFIDEQNKGNDGKFNVEDLFFMDETIVYLNEAPSYAWGLRQDGKRKETQILKTKGKTKTIAIYAGIGLTKNGVRYSHDTKAPGCALQSNAPRCNAFKMSEDGCWELHRANDLPKFCLVWWMRPPERETDALPRFLDADDIKDPSFLLPTWSTDPQNQEVIDVLHFRSIDGIGKPMLQLIANNDNLTTFIQRGVFDAVRSVYKVKLFDQEHTFEVINGMNEDNSTIININATFDPEWVNVNKNVLLTFIKGDTEIYIRNSTATTSGMSKMKEFITLVGDEKWVNALSNENLQLMLWFCGVETRQVNQNGELLKTNDDDQTEMLLTSRQRQEALLQKMGRLASFASTGQGEAPKDIPRNFHASRSFKGGPIESAHGDRSLFLRYIRHAYNFYKTFWRSDDHSDFRFAWDSAPQHGKVDITAPQKSFIHEWVEKQLGSGDHQVEAFFLPVRKPDFNPVELLFSFIKTSIRRRMTSVTGELTPNQMIALLDKSFSEVTEKMIKGWLRYGCYVVTGDPQTSFCARRNQKYLPIDDILFKILADYDFSGKNSQISKVNFLKTIGNDFSGAMRLAFSKFKHKETLKNAEVGDFEGVDIRVERNNDNNVPVDENSKYIIFQQVLDNNPKFKYTNFDPLSKITIFNEEYAISFHNHFSSEEYLIKRVQNCSSGESIRCLLEYLKHIEEPNLEFYANRLSKISRYLEGRKGLLSISGYALHRANSFMSELIDKYATSNEQLLSLLLDVKDEKKLNDGVTVCKTFQIIFKDTPYEKILQQTEFSQNPGRDSLIIVVKAFLIETQRSKRTEKNIVSFCFSQFNEDKMTKEAFNEKMQTVEDIYFRRTNSADNEGIDVAQLIQQHKEFPRKEEGNVVRRWPGYPSVDKEQYITVGSANDTAAEIINIACNGIVTTLNIVEITTVANSAVITAKCDQTYAFDSPAIVGEFIVTSAPSVLVDLAGQFAVHWTGANAFQFTARVPSSNSASVQCTATALLELTKFKQFMIVQILYRLNADTDTQEVRVIYTKRHRSAPILKEVINETLTTTELKELNSALKFRTQSTIAELKEQYKKNVVEFNRLFNRTSEESTEHRRLLDLSLQRYNISTAIEEKTHTIETNDNVTTLFKLKNNRYIYKHPSEVFSAAQIKDILKELPPEKAAIIYQGDSIIPFFEEYSYHQTKQILNSKDNVNVLIAFDTHGGYGLIVDKSTPNLNYCSLNKTQRELLPELKHVTLRKIFPHVVKVKKFQAASATIKSTLNEVLGLNPPNADDSFAHKLRLDSFTTIEQKYNGNAYYIVVTRGVDSNFLVSASKLKEFVGDFRGQMKTESEVKDHLCMTEDKAEFEQLYSSIWESYKVDR